MSKQDLSDQNVVRLDRHSVAAKWIGSLLMAVCFLSLSVGVAQGQSYQGASGMPPFVAPQPVDLGFTDAANGNLHLEISFGSYPQRGSKQPLDVKYVYDSNSIWQVTCGSVSCSWWTPDQTTSVWRLSTAAYTGVFGINCGSNGACPEYQYQDQWGTSRFFSTQNVVCPTTGAYASDSSGYFLKFFVDSQSICNEQVYAPDGSLVYWGAGSEGTPSYEDTNGNFISGGLNPKIDTLGRTIPVGQFGGGCAGTCQLPNSQGGVSTYTVTTTTIPVQTEFGQSGVGEFAGQLTVVSSLTRPDGTSYEFKYDCNSGSGNSACGSPSGQNGYYGLLTSVTLPTGETIAYHYTKFTDSYNNPVEWLSSRTGDGGTWTYSPQVISACNPSIFVYVGCQQKVTVSKPSGDSTVYTFTLNNGAWPVQIQSYDSSGNLLSTVNNTYDFSNACLFSGCHGAAYIRLTQTQTTMTVPGGSITKQTQYAYDSPQTGNVTSVKEWRYYPGTSPTFPATADRTTTRSYLSTGTNDINRPLSVSVTNSSGATIASTLFSYDSYSGSCAGGLQSVTGVKNHDDTNFGPTYTTRGNPTQVKRLVGGSTYLTAQYCYDTTGQITEEIDPQGNVTSYGYSDNFYSDNGANPPPSYVPSQATNAYATSITEPMIGTAHIGYYYGSGAQAFSADQNGATTYDHFMDPFDRPTETVRPIGWSIETYPSATEIDTYDAVGDASPSTGCTSCQHKQVFLDSFGRRIQQSLANAPGAAINTATNYDSNSRVASDSHAYTSTSDPNHVFENYSYDGLDRNTQVSHPDGQYSKVVYGALVGQAGGLTAQQGSTSTYGTGYPELFIEEEGKMKEEWLDGFGRIIEVDEPSPGNGASVGSVTISGQERAGEFQECTKPARSGCLAWTTITVSDTGTVSITVNGLTESVNYVSTSTASSLASTLAGDFNSAPSSVVTASANGGVVSFTSKTTGAGTNYSLAASSASTQTEYFSGTSFPVATSGGSLTSDLAFGSLSAPQVTLYTYDAANNLTGVVQGIQTRSFAYDGLSRKTSETTPEGGTVSFNYAGCSGDPSNACSKTDARGITTTYTYDALNRIKSKSYSNGQASVTYNYDQGGASVFALGRLTQIVDPSGSESYTYDADGEVLRLQKVTGTMTYTLEYQYNAGGEVTQITYPSGRIVQYAYDAIGRLCNVAGSNAGSCSASSYYAANYGYDSAGHVTGITFGNGIVGSFNYFPKTEQIETLNYAKGTSNLFSLNYWYQNDSMNCPNGTWNDDGPIQCITDNMDSGRSVNYAYDGVNRLISATTNGSTNYPKWGLSENYDQYSNRTAQNVTAGSGPPSSLGFNTKNQPTGSGFVYDASGNMTYDPATMDTYGYDADNQMVSVTGGATAGYTYDANGFRVEKSANGTSTVFIYSGSQDVAEYDNGAVPSSPSREFIYGNGELLAQVSGGATTYYQKDHLSVRMITDAGGNVVGQEGHFPFGEAWYSSNGSNEWVFTSYQHNQETGLEYALARYYDPRTATFCSADPVGGDPGDPESWNRYVYARDNPISISDPSGKSWFGLLIDALIGITMAVLPEVAPGLAQELGIINTEQAGTYTITASWGTSGTVVGNTIFATENAIGWTGTITATTMGPTSLAALGGIAVTNPSQSGPKQDAIDKRMQDLRDRLSKDPKCSSFLGKNGVDAVKTINKFFPHNNTDYLGHADISEGGDPYSNAAVSTPGKSSLLLVNNNGAFFNATTPKGPYLVGTNEYSGGSPKAQAEILLHELGHLTGVLRNDAGVPKAMHANDKDIQSHCGQTIGGSK